MYVSRGEWGVERERKKGEEDLFISENCRSSERERVASKDTHLPSSAKWAPPPSLALSAEKFMIFMYRCVYI